jgi:hypothetical protein
MPQCSCIESCYDSQRGELFDKGKVYEIAPTHPLIAYFDCAAGQKARDAKRAKVAKLQNKSAAEAKAAAPAEPSDPEKQVADPKAQVIDLE